MGALARIVKQIAPRGLAARAVMFTTVLMMATALLSAATIMFGAIAKAHATSSSSPAN